ncbi:hypothetical protein MNBD_ALPHA07-2083 [hydrothermal vent metagenome]|uniref:Excalibur calcium-binding domain-containing protein n=1 Tax=hydrothermal vent metagenome TaxID=652676 RepID=A0A3B0RW22_9ZZZZ
MNQSFKFLTAFIFLTACTPPSPSQQTLVNQAQKMNTASLWVQQQYTESPVMLAIVEAELAVRGETRTSTSYIGKRSRSGYRKSQYPRGGGGQDTQNCSDFTNVAQAQRFFLAAGGPVYDPNNLDRDGDGLACEWGTYINKIARSNVRAAKARTPRRYTNRVCYTGPRGGTYTITSSGRKNYGGC